ncbi:MAG: hypothetical protein JO142_02035 [Burkholderiales bacterium]|nr:hypothetical protein [Burkholderiales bacterium]
MPGSLLKDEVHEALAPYIDAKLQPLGFESKKRLTWVRSIDAPIRQVLELEEMRYDRYFLTWGYSFDFVPFFVGTALKWHKQARTAHMSIWSCEHFGKQRPYLAGFAGREGLINGVSVPHQTHYMYRGVDYLLEELDRANAYWARVTSVLDLVGLFDEFNRIQGSLTRGYGTYQLARAFCFAHAGRVAEAETMLDAYISLSLDQPFQAKAADQLRLAFETACLEPWAD